MKIGNRIFPCLVAACAAGLSEFALGEVVDVSKFASQVEFKVTGYRGETTVTDVPVLVRLASGSPAGFDPAQCSSDSIRFVDAAGNVLAHDVETWNAAGTSCVWVRLPKIAAVGTTFTLCYGGDGASVAKPSAASVWSNYAVVLHGGTTAYANAAGNAVSDAAGGTTVVASEDGYGAVGGGFVKNICFSTGLSLANPVAAGVLSIDALTISGWYRPKAFMDGTKKATSVLASNRSAWQCDYNGDGFEWLAQDGRYLSFAVNTGHNGAESSDFSWELGQWSHLATTYDYASGARICSTFCNGVQLMRGKTALRLTDGGEQWYFGSHANSSAGTRDDFGGDMDELRIMRGAATADYLAAEYAAMTDGFLAAGTVKTVDAARPLFGEPAVSVADDTVTFSVDVLSGEGEVFVDVNGERTSLGTIDTSAAYPQTFARNDLAIAAGAVWKLAAVSADGSVVKSVPGVVVNGAVQVTAAAAASENHFASSEFTVARPAGMSTGEPLLVNLAWSGVTAGVDYIADVPASVTIPAGEESVTIRVTPMRPDAYDTMKQLTLTAASGPYVAGGAATMDLNALWFVLGGDTNTWIAVDIDFASKASNWSLGHIPTATENILFDERVSKEGCIWDAGVNGLPDTVASWTQTSNYTGEVTFLTVYPEVESSAFKLMTVTGDCVLEGGKWASATNSSFSWAHPIHMDFPARTHRLNVAVGGNLTVGEKFTFNLLGKGFGNESNKKIPARAHGGHMQCDYYTNTVYGSVYEPEELGFGSFGDGGSVAGGGALKLMVAGDMVLDGLVNASGAGATRVGGSGGSVWISAKSLSGTGWIRCIGEHGSGTDWIHGVGGGGRVALYTTDALAFPVDHVLNYGLGHGTSACAGPGTTFHKSSVDTYGHLYISQGNAEKGNGWGYENPRKWSQPRMISSSAPIVAGQTWTFDSLTLREGGAISVPPGTRLVLPNGTNSVDATAGTGIWLFSDGTTDWSEASGQIYWGESVDMNDFVLHGPWYLYVSGVTFPGKVTVRSGAMLGHPTLRQPRVDKYIPVDFTVAGDLVVEDGAQLSAFETECGQVVSGAYAHGGTTTFNAASGVSYDSITNAALPGSAKNTNYAAGGVLNAVVGGTLTLDGVATASTTRGDMQSANTPAASGGSINITAAKLEGSGSMSADGGKARYCYGGVGAGGRISVRLTDGAVDPRWIDATSAIGGLNLNGKRECVGYNDASAGTIYLRGADQADGAGTLVVRNDGRLSDRPFGRWAKTPLPGTGLGCDDADAFAAGAIVLDSAAVVQLTGDLAFKTATIADASMIDLNGHVMVVNRATWRGRRLHAGTYTPDDLPEMLGDVAGGGRFIVLDGLGMLIR